MVKIISQTSSQLPSFFRGLISPPIQHKTGGNMAIKTSRQLDRDVKTETRLVLVGKRINCCSLLSIYQSQSEHTISHFVPSYIPISISPSLPSTTPKPRQTSASRPSPLYRSSASIEDQKKVSTAQSLAPTPKRRRENVPFA